MTHGPCFSFELINVLVFARPEILYGLRRSGAYLMVYSSVPSSVIRRSLFGMVMLWATDFLPLWKKVSGVQILLAIRLLRRNTAMGPLNFNLSSFQLCLKKTSMVYSYRWIGRESRSQQRSKQKEIAKTAFPLFHVLTFPLFSPSCRFDFLTVVLA